MSFPFEILNQVSTDKDAGQKGHFIQNLWELAPRWVPKSDLSRLRHSSVTLPWSESKGPKA